MKKRFLILLLMAALLTCTLSACLETAAPASNVVSDFANFTTIEGSEHLAYDTNTQVVYYMFATNESLGYQGYGYAYFAPYISESGNFCRYVDGQIVEIAK